MDTFFYPLLGGLLIGISASTMLFGIGRTAGISGILGGILGKFNKQELWRYNFIFGLLIGGFSMYLFFPSFFDFELSSNPLKVIIAGLLVGYGTRLGNGCTSGHGVCGMARLSKRSIFATLIFISFGVLTVLIERLLWAQ